MMTQDEIEAAEAELRASLERGDCEESFFCWFEREYEVEAYKLRQSPDGGRGYRERWIHEQIRERIDDRKRIERTHAAQAELILRNGSLPQGEERT